MPKEYWARSWARRLAGGIGLCVGLSISIGQARSMTAEQMADWQRQWKKAVEIEKQSNDFNHTNDQATVKKLQKLELDHVSLGNIDVASVCKMLTYESRDSDPEEVGAQFTVKFPANMLEPDVLGHQISRIVCIVLNSRISFFDLLMSISEQTNLAFKVNRGEVVFEKWEPGAYVSLPELTDPM